MGRIVDLTGRKFGKLTVIKLESERTKAGQTNWLCECECGTQLVLSQLVSQKKISCGCDRVKSEISKSHVGVHWSQLTLGWNTRINGVTVGICAKKTDAVKIYHIAASIVKEGL